MLPQALEPQAVELQQALVVQVLEEQQEMELQEEMELQPQEEWALKAQEVAKEPLKAQEEWVLKALAMAMIWVPWVLIILVVVDDLTMDFSVLESQFLTWLL